jgi:RimJ/RimL family protein N-acetyltransferase
MKTAAAIEIITPRLILRTPRLTDVDVVQKAKLEVWYELQLWMNWAYDSQKNQDALKKFIESSLSKNPHECLLGFCRSTGDFVISSGINREKDTDIYSMGYWVAQPHLGKGFATEATNAILRYGFNVLKAKAVKINYYEGNDKSHNVIRKCGFQFVETVKGGHKRCLDGVPLDVHHFVRTNAEGLPDLQVSWKH